MINIAEITATPAGLTWSGPDASLEISLVEYGILWAETPEGNFRFIYRTPEHDSPGFITTSWAEFDGDTDPQEWSWINWEDFLDAIDSTAEEWEARGLARGVYDLLRYYGHLNVFGDCYCVSTHRFTEEPHRVNTYLITYRPAEGAPRESSTIEGPDMEAALAAFKEANPGSSGHCISLNSV